MAQRTEKIHEVPIQQIDVHTDTREILANARQQAEERNYQDYVIFDVDAHHIETVHWGEICEYIEDPVIRSQAVTSQKANPYGLIGDRGMTYQDVGGRIPHDTARNETVEETDVHRDVVLTRRAMESMGLDYQVVFPTPMLSLGTHPQLHMEVLLGRAHNRWMVENLLKADNRIKSMLYLPISDPVASLKVIEEFGEEPGVIGFMVTSVRNKAIQENQYMKVYAALEERGLPLAFHGGYYWHEPAMALFNQFVGMHCVAFVLWNLVHLVNWVLNGLPERFPKLKVIWLESGLSWIPFIMQRLDSEYMLRSSEAPALKRLPSEYIREMFFSSQPMERHNLEALELTMKMMKAETQLLYASDWPHWDFDAPSVIWDLPFLDEDAKRNILGRNADRVFDLDK
jgi:predicted TIM-barrel fold metal-dependent hydrolase